MKSINQSTKQTIKPINNSNNQSTKRAISQPNKQSINQTSNQLNVYVYTVYIVIYLLIYIYTHLVGAFNPSEKYESQFGLLFPIYGTKKNQVPNHQPNMYTWPIALRSLGS